MRRRTAPPRPGLRRRPLLLWPLVVSGGGARADAAAAVRALRAGGAVLALRHALAPGTFDPPGFRLDDCRTQRNLDDSGRAQARALGERLRRLGLEPLAVRSSPWCRCLDTARLAFGRAESWAALGSPRGSSETTSADHLRQLRQALAARRGTAGFEVWVTHGFVLQALAGSSTASGDGFVLRGDAAGGVSLVAPFSAG